jgi:hypothetical protein
MSEMITRSSSLSAGDVDGGPAKTVEGEPIGAVGHVRATLLAASGDAEGRSSAAAQDVPGIRQTNGNRRLIKKRSSSHRAQRKAGATAFSSKRCRGTETSPWSSSDVDADEEEIVIVGGDNVDAGETDGARSGSCPRYIA